MPDFKLHAAVAFLAGFAAPAAAQEVVPVSHFDQIELNGGGMVTVRHGPVQRVIIRSGSSEFTRIRVARRNAHDTNDRLTIDACNERCPRRYELRIEIETPQIGALAVNGGGEISAASGFPGQHDIALSVQGGGEIDTRAIAVGDVAASVQGGGLMLVRASDTLAASVQGGGEVRYWGSPEVSAAIDGGGRVHKGQ